MSTGPAPAQGWAGLKLVCPRCRAALVVDRDGAACPQCGAFYPVENGVLRLLAGRVGAPGYDPHYFPELAAVEAEHYWFLARRQVVHDLLRGSVPDLDQRAIFDIGCGSGGLLAFLAERGVRVAGACDVYVESLRLASRRIAAAPLVLVDEGRFPPLGPGQTLVGMFDVLEHIDDDSGTLGHLFSILAPGGILVLTVPAHPFLFDEMDVIAHHRRRYTRGELSGKLRGAGFVVRRLTHFMAPLMPLLGVRWLARAATGGRRVHQRRRLELRVLPVLNRLMRAVLALERPLVRRGVVPFGSSLLAVAAKPGGGEV